MGTLKKSKRPKVPGYVLRGWGLKLSKADREFSFLVRSKAGWTCERCGTHYPPERRRGLHVAHMFSRRYRSEGPSGRPLRFDPENAAALCYGCHSYLDSHPMQKIGWFTEHLGRERFERLSWYAHGARDRV